MHISHCWLFKAKSFLYIYIEYIWFGLVGIYGISIIVGYFMQKSSLWMFIECIWFRLLGESYISAEMQSVYSTPQLAGSTYFFDWGWVFLKEYTFWSALE